MPQHGLNIYPAFAVVALSTLLTACGGGSVDDALQARHAPSPQVGSYTPSAEALGSDPHQQSRLPEAVDRASVTQLRLGGLSTTAAKAAQGDKTPPAATLQLAPKAVATGRSLPELARAVDVQHKLVWRPGSHGWKTARIEIASPGAVGLRAAVQVTALPERARLRFYAPQDAVEYVFDAEDVRKHTDGNRSAGDTTPAAALFWSPHVAGEVVVVAVDIPVDTEPATVVLSVPKLSHFFESPMSAAAENPSKVGESGGCHADVSCHPSLNDVSNATAKIVYSDGFGGSFLCTGTLLNDRSASLTPYFLTANHCISRQTEAASVQTFWFYRSSACNSGAVNTGAQTRTGGATLLRASAETDVSLLRLNTAPPPGALYAGWDSNTLAQSSSLAGVHHPSGDLQKVAFGAMTGYCSGDSVSSQITCINQTGAGAYFDVRFNIGTTEGGSSGSGIFRTGSDGQQYLVGQLFGGNSSCQNLSGTNVYGRFDLSYRNGLSQWLDAGTAPAPTTPVSYTLTVTRTGGGTGTVVSVPAGLNCGSQCSASFVSGASVTLQAQASVGSVFSGWSGACTGTSACVVSMSAARQVLANFNPQTTGAAVNLVANGGFESGPSAWTSSDDMVILPAPTRLPAASSGSNWLAWLCGYDNCFDRIQQDIAIPSGAGRVLLSFKYLVETLESYSGQLYDALVVELGTAGNSRVVTSLSNLTQAGTWQTFSADITEFAGQTARLVFTALSDASLLTSFFVDDVSISTIGSGTTTALPQSGWWWNPAESGHGFAIERQGSSLFLSGFMYETSGEATWYASNMVRQSDGSYLGQLLRYEGGQSISGSYRAPGAPTSPASARLAVSTSSRGTLTITATSGQRSTINLERLALSAFAPSSAVFENGWWWNPQESGRGYFIEVQGSQAFTAMFTYEASGRPTWYAMATTLSGNSTLTAPYEQYAGGQSLQGSYRAPTVAGSPGGVSFQLRSPTTGTLTLPNGQVISVQRFQFGS